jgi:adenosylcobinamide-phosphate synthase
VRLEYQIITAMALDGLVGDPRWLPHPVKLIGALAARLERLSRRLVPWEYAAGGVTAAIVVSAAGAAAWLIVAGAAALHPLAGDAASILLLYTTFAARDLAGHGAEVFRELQAGNLPQARRKVAMMVGRDTESLDEEGIARAAVESVAENTVDGVTAPLLYAIAGGPVAAMMYKAVNTLDSTFGYKTERYLRFGWASAKLDDFANYLPARITALFMVVAAALLRMRAGRAWGTLIRDGRKHTSPNSGLCEAAMAGALGVRLGGRNYYFGKPSDKPYIGNPGAPPRKDDIRRGNRLMLATYMVTAAVFLCARMVIAGQMG